MHVLVAVALLLAVHAAGLDCELPSPLEGDDVLPPSMRLADRSAHAPMGLPLDGSGGLVFQGDLSRWRRVAAKTAQANASLDIVILGGSMAAGHMDDLAVPILESHRFRAKWFTQCGSQCFDEVQLPRCFTSCDDGRCRRGQNHALIARPCAFGERFGHWLQRAYPRATVRVHNCAVGGTSSEGFLPFVGRTPRADIFLLHFVDNDWAAAGGTMDGVEGISAAFELLIRALLRRPNMPAILELQQAGGAARNLSGGEWWAHSLVARHYGVPILSIEKNVVSPDFTLHARHPPWPWHQLLADVLAYAWRHQACAGGGNAIGSTDDIPGSLPTPLSELTVRRAGMEFCESEPLTFIRSDGVKKTRAKQLGTEVVRATPHWRHGPDREGSRPGWWANASAGGEIVFDVTVNENHPVIVIGFLTSYENMGSARFYLDGDRLNGGVIVNASESHGRFSLVRTQLVCKPTSDAGLNNEVDELAASFRVSFRECEAVRSRRLKGHTPPPRDIAKTDLMTMTKGNSMALRARRHRLHVELLPSAGSSASSASAGNKFKVYTITSC
jgi:hypothetical protein